MSDDTRAIVAAILVAAANDRDFDQVLKTYELILDRLQPQQPPSREEIREALSGEAEPPGQAPSLMG